jgi:uncharacterized protein YchJ
MDKLNNQLEQIITELVSNGELNEACLIVSHELKISITEATFIVDTFRPIHEVDLWAFQPQQPNPIQFLSSNTLLNELFSTGLDISDEKLESILALPRHLIIPDLERIIEYTVEHGAYYYNLEEYIENLESFIVHAIFLLTELQAQESLPVLLKFLAEDEKMVEFWLGDYITESIWQDIFVLGSNQTDLLLDFVINTSASIWCKIAVFEAVTQLALHYPEKKAQINQWVERVLHWLSLTENHDENIILISSFIAAIMNARATEFIDKIKPFFDADLVDEFFTGDWNEVLTEIYSEANENRKELLAIGARYKLFAPFNLDNETDDFTYFNEDWEDGDEDKLYVDGPIKRTEPKIGRNEPCPCGSGKKYKKCCLNSTQS